MRRKLDSHKGDYGHVFVLAGSRGLTGAAYLACQACMLSGSGLVTLGIPESLNPVMEVKLTEVMTLPLAETKEASLSLKAWPQIREFSAGSDALAVGPGLSRNPQTMSLVRKVLSGVNKKPLVLDADGINALAGKLKMLADFKGDIVITPHPGEMSNLLRLKTSQIQKNRVKLAKDFAGRYNVTVVLKGHQTVVAGRRGQSYINKTGNPGMASAGCGDVLTGMIASFLGQGMSGFEAAKKAVYLHGVAGDNAAKEKGEISLIARDILEKLPGVFKTSSK